jgi:hypothetical protein
MSRAPLPDLELQRALWRQEHDTLSPTRAGRLLLSQYLLAVHGFEALRDHAWAVRQHDPALLREYDDFRSRGARAADLRDHRALLEQVIRGRRLLAVMRAVVDAHGRITAATQALARLHSLAATPRIRSLPSFTAPAALLALARARMGGGRYVQAGLLADEMVRQVETLCAPRALPLLRLAEVERQIGELRDLCADTAGLLPDPSGDLAGDGTLDGLATLPGGGFGELAGRLAAELMASLAARAQFRRELLRFGAPAADETPAALRTVIGETDEHRVWAAGTKHLWRTRISRESERLHARSAAPRDAGADAGAAAPPLSTHP